MNQDGMEPPKKKLKQARLDFFNSPCRGPSKSPKVAIDKKRKALDSEPNELRVSKIVRRIPVPEKENVALPMVKGNPKEVNGNSAQSDGSNNIKGSDFLQNVSDDVTYVNLVSPESITVLDSGESNQDQLDIPVKGDALKPVTGDAKENLPLIDSSTETFCKTTQDYVDTLSVCDENKLADCGPSKVISEYGPSQKVFVEQEVHPDNFSLLEENCSNSVVNDSDVCKNISTECHTIKHNSSQIIFSDGKESQSCAKGSSLEMDAVKLNDVKTPTSDVPQTIMEGSDFNESDSSFNCSNVVDENVCSTPESSFTPSDASESKSGRFQNKPSPLRKLTPKQLLRREASLKKKEEAEKFKKERYLEKQKKREEKMKVKAAEVEQKKNKKIEKKRLKEREIEEKIEMKNVKRKKREEERMQKEEEKKKKKEEKLKGEELKEEAKRMEKMKEEQSRAAFESFFKPKNQRLSDVEVPKATSSECVESYTFMPFPVKNDMKLAAVNRRVLTKGEIEEVDKYLKDQVKPDGSLYLEILKNGDHQPLVSFATWPSCNLDDQHDVIIIESVKDNVEDFDNDCFEVQPSNKRKPYRAKFLHFHENRRPAYWGTWRKKSSAISPRRPFGKDEKWLEYEADSDLEWEDEEEGENIDIDGGKDSDEEPEEQTGGENGYILDNQFVPHGYLSDEEAQDREENISPEAQKLRLTALKEEFDEEMKHKTERLKPRLLGVVWISNRTAEIPKGILYETLMQHRCVWDESSHAIDVYGEPLYDSPVSAVPKTKQLPVEVEAALVKMVHGSQRSLVRLVKDFIIVAETDFPEQKLKKNHVSSKIKELCTKIHNAQGKLVWSVKSDLCSTYNVTSIMDSAPKPATPPATGKQKDNALKSFLSKGSSTPVKKRVSLTPAITPPAPIEKTPSSLKAAGPKKKVSLISLPHTPRTERKPVHQATPHPSFKILNNY